MPKAVTAVTKKKAPATKPNAIPAIVFDTETTGLGDDAEIIQSATKALSSVDDTTQPTVLKYWKPSRPISYEAMATHHIIEDDLVGQTPSAEFKLQASTYLIGHNVRFDWRMAGEPDVLLIDTLGLARNSLELDSYTLGTVMYALFPAVEARSLLQSAHNAECDVDNTHKVFMRLCELQGIKTFEEAHAASEEGLIPKKIAFGKHRGTLIEDLPWDYVQWLFRQNDLDPYLITALKRYF